MEPQFYRSALLLGKEGIEALGTKKVAVLGVGGVGSFVVEALVRGGIGRLLLVDHDTIDITNCNRQLPATVHTVGQYKTKVLQERILAIHPKAMVETKEQFILPNNIEEVLGDDCDYLVDALDTITTKLAIAEYGFARGIPVISCMGAGNKLDPTQLQIADLYATSVCPLCRVMRHELRKRGVPRLKVVYSSEPPRTPDYAQLPPEEEQKLLAGSKGRGTPGSVSFVPPVAGMVAAGEVIKDLIQ